MTPMTVWWAFSWAPSPLGLWDSPAVPMTPGEANEGIHRSRRSNAGSPKARSLWTTTTKGSL